MLEHAMTQTCQIFSTTVNKFGDFVEGGSVNMPCKFRYINALDRQANREGFQSDAMAWFKVDSDIREGTIFRVDGAKFRVERVVKARRLANSTVLFLKAYLERYHDIAVS
jgi:hypothetical protein